MMETNHYHKDEWQKHYKPLSKRQTMETQEAILMINDGNKPLSSRWMTETL